MAECAVPKRQEWHFLSQGWGSKILLVRQNSLTTHTPLAWIPKVSTDYLKVYMK